VIRTSNCTENNLEKGSCVNDQIKQMDRRAFLEWSGVGMAGLAARPFWTFRPTPAVVPTRIAPVEPILLKSSKLELVLDRNDGLPFEYRLLAAKEKFRGEDLGQPITVTLCDRGVWKFASLPVTAPKLKTTAHEADFTFEAKFDRKDLTDLFYLNLLPWFRVYRRNIEFFRREGERTIIGLEGNSGIEQDWVAKTYSVILEGREIARDLATFCNLDANRFAFYAYTEREWSVPVPATWNPSDIAAVALFPKTVEHFPVQTANGKIWVSAPARQAVIVYRTRAMAEPRITYAEL
jgi:hypothetical protein